MLSFLAGGDRPDKVPTPTLRMRELEDGLASRRPGGRPATPPYSAGMFKSLRMRSRPNSRPSTAAHVPMAKGTSMDDVGNDMSVQGQTLRSTLSDMSLERLETLLRERVACQSRTFTARRNFIQQLFEKAVLAGDHAAASAAVGPGVAIAMPQYLDVLTRLNLPVTPRQAIALFRRADKKRTGLLRVPDFMQYVAPVQADTSGISWSEHSQTRPPTGRKTDGGRPSTSGGRGNSSSRSGRARSRGHGDKNDHLTLRIGSSRVANVDKNPSASRSRGDNRAEDNAGFRVQESNLFATAPADRPAADIIGSSFQDKIEHRVSGVHDLFRELFLLTKEGVLDDKTKASQQKTYLNQKDFIQLASEMGMRVSEEEANLLFERYKKPNQPGISVQDLVEHTIPKHHRDKFHILHHDKEAPKRSYFIEPVDHHAQRKHMTVDHDDVASIMSGRSTAVEMKADHPARRHVKTPDHDDYVRDLMSRPGSVDKVPEYHDHQARQHYENAAAMRDHLHATAEGLVVDELEDETHHPNRQHSNVDVGGVDHLALETSADDVNKATEHIPGKRHISEQEAYHRRASQTRVKPHNPYFVERKHDFKPHDYKEKVTSMTDWRVHKPQHKDTMVVHHPKNGHAAPKALLQSDEIELERGRQMHPNNPNNVTHMSSWTAPRVDHAEKYEHPDVGAAERHAFLHKHTGYTALEEARVTELKKVRERMAKRAQQQPWSPKAAKQIPMLHGAKDPFDLENEKMHLEAQRKYHPDIAKRLEAAHALAVLERERENLPSDSSQHKSNGDAQGHARPGRPSPRPHPSRGELRHAKAEHRQGRGVRGDAAVQRLATKAQAQAQAQAQGQAQAQAQGQGQGQGQGQSAGDNSELDPKALHQLELELQYKAQTHISKAVNLFWELYRMGMLTRAHGDTARRLLNLEEFHEVLVELDMHISDHDTVAVFEHLKSPGAHGITVEQLIRAVHPRWIERAQEALPNGHAGQFHDHPEQKHFPDAAFDSIGARRSNTAELDEVEQELDNFLHSGEIRSTSTQNKKSSRPGTSNAQVPRLNLSSRNGSHPENGALNGEANARALSRRSQRSGSGSRPATAGGAHRGAVHTPRFRPRTPAIRTARLVDGTEVPLHAVPPAHYTPRNPVYVTGKDTGPNTSIRDHTGHNGTVRLHDTHPPGAPRPPEEAKQDDRDSELQAQQDVSRANTTKDHSIPSLRLYQLSGTQSSRFSSRLYNSARSAPKPDEPMTEPGGPKLSTVGAYDIGLSRR